MTEQPQHNIRAIRDLLVRAFSIEELRGLFRFAENHHLRPVADLFAPEDGKPTMARKAVEYCRSHFLLDEFLAEIKDANPRAYERFEPKLLHSGVEQPVEEAAAGPTPEILTITSPIYLDLVRIPAGEFLMGSVAARDEDAWDHELPQHSVHVPEFYIGQYPVTNAQYRTFVKATGYYAPVDWESGGIFPGKGDHPVTFLSWRDALAFCAWLGEATGQPFRLPTEAEWEKAARGTDGRIYPWGDEPPDANRCNFDGQVKDTTPIARYSPQGDSPYSCTDMAGNVWEWCQSLYRPYPYRAGDGREQMEGDEPRILRGGAYLVGRNVVRCGYRFYSPPDYTYDLTGFRVASGPLK